MSNELKFANKWRTVLEAEHYPDGENVYFARDRSHARKHILVVDHYVPKVDRDGGSRMIYDFLRLFVDAGLQVAFWPDNGHYDRPYAQMLQGFGIEILYGLDGPRGFRDWVEQNGRYLDYAFLHRPHVSQRYIDALCEASPAKRIFYGADLHYLRLEREAALTNRLDLRQEAEHMHRIEAYVWERSDIVYYPSAEEVALVQQEVPDRKVLRFPVQVYSNDGIRAARGRARERRPKPATILYVAGFAHRPNVDAFLWFAREVLPIVKKALPDSVTICAGSFPPSSITSLVSDDLIVTQAISWPVLDWFYKSAHVAIAPIRYGGGMKGKILEAMRYAVPVVSTGAGVEGFDGAAEMLAIADTPEAFADCVIEVLRDPRSATRRVFNALDYIEQNFSYTAVAARLAPEIPELELVTKGQRVLY